MSVKTEQPVNVYLLKVFRQLLTSSQPRTANTTTVETTLNERAGSGEASLPAPELSGVFRTSGGAETAARYINRHLFIRLDFYVAILH